MPDLDCENWIQIQHEHDQSIAYQKATEMPLQRLCIMHLTWGEGGGYLYKVVLLFKTLHGNGFALIT